MKSLIIYALLILVSTSLGSCSSVPQHQEIIHELPPPKETVPHRPTDCRHLYNVGRSSEWFDCMGVGYVTK